MPTIVKMLIAFVVGFFITLGLTPWLVAFLHGGYTTYGNWVFRVMGVE